MRSARLLRYTFYAPTENRRGIVRVGDVVISTEGTSDAFPPLAKAFRHAPAKCAGATRVTVMPYNGRRALHLVEAGYGREGSSNG